MRTVLEFQCLAKEVSLQNPIIYILFLIFGLLVVMAFSLNIGKNVNPKDSLISLLETWNYTK